MADNVPRSRGRPESYKLDAGGTAADTGPFIGIVVNNVDNTRQGRLQVAIKKFGAINADGTPNLKVYGVQYVIAHRFMAQLLRQVRAHLLEPVHIQEIAIPMVCGLPRQIWALV